MNLETKEEQQAFKQELKASCLTLIEQRIATARQAMEQAQESANQEDKSSAGDKYETSRAMGQLDRDMNARQLQEALQELQGLQTLAIDPPSDSVLPGAVLVAGELMFFVAIGLGQLTVLGRKLIVLSPKSPLYASIRQKRSGDTFLFQNKVLTIDRIF